MLPIQHRYDHGFSGSKARGFAAVAFGQVIDFPSRNPNLSTPRGKVQSASVNHDDSAYASIATLLRPSGPSAVFWRVISVIVFAVKGVVRRWPMAHVGIEVFETVKPASANGDAATAIDAKLWMARVVTSVLHSRPCSMFWRFAHAVRQCIFVVRKKFFSPLSGKASATPRCLVSEIGGSHYSCIAAITMAQPESVSTAWGRGSSTDDLKLSVTTPSQILHLSNLPTTKNYNMAWGQ